MTCDACPSPAAVVSPGTEPTRDLFLLSHGEPMRCWCLPCWRRQFLHEPAGRAA